MTKRLFVAWVITLVACTSFGADDGGEPAPGSQPDAGAGPETAEPEAGPLDCPGPNADPTLVAYYPFETDGVAKDCSGNGHDGSLVGARRDGSSASSGAGSASTVRAASTSAARRTSTSRRSRSRSRRG